jgi:hypothetical protein
MSVFPGRPAQVGPAHNEQSPILHKSALFAYLKLGHRAAALPKFEWFSPASVWTTIPLHFRMEDAMRADLVELSWDTAKSKWLVRIASGEEVIRRHYSAPKDANEQTLISAAQQTVSDEGYEADPAQISIKR